MPHIRIDDPDLPLVDMMAHWPATASVFLRHRMACVGCLISPFHTIVDACAEYGLEEEDLIAELRRAIETAP